MLESTVVRPPREHFRPYFAVDQRMRVRVWPDQTARALGIPEDHARGRPCWQLLGARAHCRDCRRQSRGCVSPASCCARLRVTAGDGGWLVWVPPTLISGGPAGSVLLESMLVRGALVESVAQCSLDEVLEALRTACAANDCELFLREPGVREVVLRGCVGQDREAFLECTRMPIGVGYPGRVTATGKPLSTDHFQSDRRFRRQAVKQCGIRTFIGVPLLESGQTIGYLGLGWKDAPIPIDWGVRLLEAVRSIAVVAVGRTERGVRLAPPPRVTAVRCLGPFTITGEGWTLVPAAFPRRKALDLLRHLLLARGTALTRDALIERLWPDVDPKTGANRLHVTLHALRRVLRAALPGAGEGLIQHLQGDYWLEPETLGPVDAFQFADALDEARRRVRARDPGGALLCLEQALPLYRGELFADAEDVFFEAARQRFRDRHREALRLLVDLYLRDDRVEAALAALVEARERTADDYADWHDALLHQVVERRRASGTVNARPRRPHLPSPRPE